VVIEPTPGFAEDARYETVGSIADTSDVDYYPIKSPKTGGPVLTIRVHSLEDAGLVPQVTVLDRKGNPLPLTVLVNGGGGYVVQVSGMPASEDISFGVSGTPNGELFATGNYQLTASFGADAITLPSVASGTLTPASPAVERTLYVALPQLFDFALAVPA